jgi:cGMP-dependent protein kinase
VIFLAEGECKIIINGKAKKTLTEGMGFGELALLYSAPRSASVRCDQETFLWGINRLLFKRIMQNYK